MKLERILNMLMPKPLKEYPKRGQIYVADLDPAYGREIHKKRPVLIISNNNINQIYPTIITVPFSSIVPEFIGPDVVKFSGQKGLDKESALITSQMRSIDKERLIEKVGKISKRKMQEVEEALKLVLGMTPID